jgi:hypothetical protein
MKNLERLILKEKIKENKLLETNQYIKNNNSVAVSKKNLIKMYQLRKTKNIIHYF